jgi:homoserine acetyltransferase
VGFKLTMLMVICTDCIGSCKSNYHTTTTAPREYIDKEKNTTNYIGIELNKAIKFFDQKPMLYVTRNFKNGKIEN